MNPYDKIVDPDRHAVWQEGFDVGLASVDIEKIEVLQPDMESIEVPMEWGSTKDEPKKMAATGV